MAKQVKCLHCKHKAHSLDPKNTYKSLVVIVAAHLYVVPVGRSRNWIPKANQLAGQALPASPGLNTETFLALFVRWRAINEDTEASVYMGA